jgi:hypothetical protein
VADKLNVEPAVSTGAADGINGVIGELSELGVGEIGAVGTQVVVAGIVGDGGRENVCVQGVFDVSGSVVVGCAVDGAGG